MSNDKELTFKEMKEIKDIYLAKKQGEALERITYPRLEEEAIALGYYGAQTVLAIGILRAYEAILNEVTGTTSTPLHTFTADIGRASGSRDAKRMEKSLETVGQLGQYFPMESRSARLAPEAVDFNKRSD